MTRDQFVQSLRAILSDHSRDAATRMRDTLESIPPAARGLDIQIMPSQDGDGPFSVYASLETPVPMVDPDDVDFEVNDAIVDAVAGWLQEVWRALEIRADGLPVRIVGGEGWGTVTPLTLRS